MVTETIAEFYATIRGGADAPESIPSHDRPSTLEEGYAVQAQLVEKLLSVHGGSVAGYKVACTNTHAQELLNTNAPVYARLLSSLVWQSGTVLCSADFPMHVVEAEFGFEIAKDVPTSGETWTRKTIADYVGPMVPAIELVGHRFGDWSTYDGPSLAADNAVHQGWIHGVPTTAWRGLDLASHQVRVLANGELRRTGQGANVLGHPLNVIAWLANELPSHGLALAAGDYITTGVATDIYPTSPDERVTADFGALGSVNFMFSS